MANVELWKELSDSEDVYLVSLDQEAIRKNGNERYVVNKLSRQEALNLCEQLRALLKEES